MSSPLHDYKPQLLLLHTELHETMLNFAQKKIHIRSIRLLHHYSSKKISTATVSGELRRNRKQLQQIVHL